MKSQGDQKREETKKEDYGTQEHKSYVQDTVELQNLLQEKSTNETFKAKDSISLFYVYCKAMNLRNG